MRGSSRSTGPAQGPSQPVPPVVPTPLSSYTGAGGVPIPAGLVPKTKLLSAIADKTGTRYLQKSKPYSPCLPTDEDLWAAHRLLNGKDEWAVQGPTFLPAGHPRRSDGKGAKYGCDFCPKVFTNLIDGRGHTQVHHMGGKLSSPLCPCNKRFNSSSVLGDNMDLKHNAHPSAIQNDPPFNFLIYLDHLAGDVLPHHSTHSFPSNFSSSSLSPVLLLLYLSPTLN